MCPIASCGLDCNTQERKRIRRKRITGRGEWNQMQVPWSQVANELKTTKAYSERECGG